MLKQSCSDTANDARDYEERDDKQKMRIGWLSRLVSRLLRGFHSVPKTLMNLAILPRFTTVYHSNTRGLNRGDDRENDHGSDWYL